LRQNLDMLMPIDKSWSGAKMRVKTIELAGNFPADLGSRQFLLPRGLEQLANFRQPSGRREGWHVSKRATQRQIEVEPDVGLGLEGAKLTRAPRP
jgi:hypothetical protein